MLARKRQICLLIIGMLLASVNAYSQGVVVVAGGGYEGDIGNTSSWSYLLYKRLVENGDTNGDGVVKVAILATEPPADNFLRDYFVWLGTQVGRQVAAKDFHIPRRADANSSMVNEIGGYDVVFIKGGDQGVYYDEWNETLLEINIRQVASRGGAIGGTSAGAMSLAEYSFSGGRDLVSTDVLADSHTSYLNDASLPGTSGIHADFFSFVPKVVIDTHYTQRARMGRLIGIMAKAVEDFADRNLLAIGIEQKTGLVIRNGIAEVVGVGEVAFLRESASSVLRRTAGRPLFYTDLVLDRLTHGWRYDLTRRVPVTDVLPAGVVPVSYAGSGSANSGALTIDGAIEADAAKFNYRASYYPNDYSLITSSLSTYIRNAIGFTDCGNIDNRMDKQETIFRALYDRPSDTAFLVHRGGAITRMASEPDVVSFARAGSASEVATIVISGKTATYKGLSPFISNYASRGGSLRAAALTNLTVHVLAESSIQGYRYNTRTCELIFSGGSILAEVEPNDSRSSAQNLAFLPVTVRGYISSTADKDYFKIQLAPGQRVTVTLQVPAAGDYDLYFMNSKGNTLVRSVNSGYGIPESLTYTNTSSKMAVFYVEVESYRGASTTSEYVLTIQP
ncbi:MAG: Type 1 glutamine amidotransferase-like domain-containing protein [Acidobacteriota bacterium]|nr:Type 1 glutamine amidotransferase-like domain-containing protein [Blastocatellia bacterium]MDW8412777.1 Type 1 glutamine amidotransferase-like domain-containing protein [Acidobacteriota bacterium]